MLCLGAVPVPSGCFLSKELQGQGRSWESPGVRDRKAREDIKKNEEGRARVPRPSGSPWGWEAAGPAHQPLKEKTSLRHSHTDSSLSVCLLLLWLSARRAVGLAACPGGPGALLSTAIRGGPVHPSWEQGGVQLQEGLGPAGPCSLCR